MSVSDLNLALLTVDALRADHLSCYGYDRKTSPALDKWAAKGVRFQNAFSASSHTREAVPALLTGQYPEVFSDNGYKLVADSIPTFLGDGVRTGAFHSNPYVSRAYGFDHDFDTFDDDLYLGKHKIVALAQRVLDKLRDRHYARAETINQRSLSWLDELPDNDPFFLWNHYMDIHGPYHPPDNYRHRFGSCSISSREAMHLYHKTCRDPEAVTEEERQTQIDLYDGEIAYVDTQIDAFLKALKARGHLDNSLVVVTSDHGEAFGEQGYFGHPRRLDDEVLQVPLLVLDPQVDTGCKVTDPVSLLDVVPTFLDFVQQTTEGLPGCPLQNYYLDRLTPDRDHVFSQVRAKDDHAHKRWYRAQGVNTSARAVADIATKEWNIEGSTSASTKNALANHVRNRLSQDNDVTSDAMVETADEDVERRLKALGYKK